MPVVAGSALFKTSCKAAIVMLRGCVVIQLPRLTARSENAALYVISVRCVQIKLLDDHIG